MRIAVVTLFPVMIREALAHGVVGRAAERGLLSVECFDPRDDAIDAHRTVDDRSYGGGPGMVLKVEPLRSTLRRAAAACTWVRTADGSSRPWRARRARPRV
jgi:tRNA (guanine37-N1)-methyltransferase